MLRKRFTSFIAVLLSLALVWTGGNVADAALILCAPDTVAGFRQISFVRNQELIRLETEALSAQTTSAIEGILNPQTRPYWARLFSTFKSLLPPGEIAATGWMAFHHGFSFHSLLIAVGTLILVRLSFSLITLSNEWGHMAVARGLGYQSVWTRQNAMGNLPWTVWVLSLAPFSGFLPARWTAGRPSVDVPELENIQTSKAKQSDQVIRRFGLLAGSLGSIPLLAAAWIVPAISFPLIIGVVSGLLWASYSDLWNGETPGKYFCGNLLYSGKLTVDQLMDLLEPSITDLLNRGTYSFGYSFMIPVKRKVPKAVQIPGFEQHDEIIVWEYVVKKVWVPKRTGGVELAMASIRAEVAKAYERAAYIPDVMMFSFHSRLGTVGSHKETVQDLTEAAQPAVAPPEGQPEDWELRQEPRIVEGRPRMVPVYVLIKHLFQFNGDISGTKAIHRKQAGQHATGNTDARARFGRWLGYAVPESQGQGSILWRILTWPFRMIYRLYKFFISIFRGSGKLPPGDAPLEALQYKLFNTERLWYASIRYALFTHSIAPDDPRDRAVPFDRMERWNVLFQQAFRQWEADKPEVAAEWLKKPTTQAEADVIQATMAEHAASFRTYLQSLPDVVREISEYLPNAEERETFFMSATIAYWRNTMEYAVLVEMKARMEGTEALDASSTLNPPDGDVSRIETAQGQNLIYGVDREGKVMVIGSDRIVLPKHLTTHRVMMQSNLNSSSVIGSPPGQPIRLMLTHGVENTVVTNADARKRLIRPFDHRNGNGNGNGLPAKDGILEHSIQKAAMQAPKINERWKPVHQGRPSDNRMPANEMLRIFMQRRIYKVLMAALRSNMLVATDMDAWAWAQAEPLSRDMLSFSKSWQDVFQEILGLATAQRLKEYPGSPDPRRIDIPFDDSCDGIIVATGKTKLAAMKAARSMEQNTGLNIRVMVGNKMIKIARNHKKDVDGFLYELRIDRHTPIFLASDSGAETYEPNVLKAYLPYVTEEPFGIGGSEDSQLVDAFGPARVLSTFNEGSKSQDGLAAYVSMLQTFEEFSLFVSENITARFKTGTADWRTAPFFRTPFTHDQVAQILRPTNDYSATRVPQGLLGYTAAGERLETRPGSNTSANLRAEGHELANRQRELSRKMVYGWAYAFVMIVVAGFGVGFCSLIVGSHLGSFMHMGYAFVHGLYGLGISIPYVQIPVHCMGSFLHPYLHLIAVILRVSLVFAARIFDYLVDVSFSLGLLLLKRWIYLKRGWSKTQLFEGFGLPTFIYISPYAWVHDALIDMARAAQGLAYTSTKSWFEGSDSYEANDAHRATGNRNTIVVTFAPGDDHPIFKFDKEEADQARRHFMTQASLPLPDRLRWLAWIFPFIKPTPPRVIDAGTSKPIAPDDQWGLMAHTEEMKVTATNLVAAALGQPVAEIPVHIAEYVLEHYDSFIWLLMWTRVLFTQLHEAAQGVFFGLFFRYPEGRFFGGGAVKSTKASADGSEVLLASQELEKTVPMRMIPIVSENHSVAEPQESPVTVVEAAVWKAWPRPDWLPLDAEAPSDIVQPAPRPVTTVVVHSSSRPNATRLTSTARASRLLRPDVRRGDGDATSLITHQESVGQVLEPLWEIPLNLDGTLGGFPNGIPEDAARGLRLIVNAFPGQPLPVGDCDVAIVRGLGRTARFTADDLSENPASGVFALHEHLVVDAAKGVKGAKIVGILEMAEERYHQLQIFNRDPGSKSHLETEAILHKIGTFLLLKEKEQDDAIDYLKSTDNLFDLEHNFAAIYRQAQTDFRSRIDAMNDQEAIDQTLDAIQPSVADFVERVFASASPERVPTPASPQNSPHVEPIASGQTVSHPATPATPAVSRRTPRGVMKWVMASILGVCLFLAGIGISRFVTGRKPANNATPADASNSQPAPIGTPLRTPTRLPSSDSSENPITEMPHAPQGIASVPAKAVNSVDLVQSPAAKSPASKKGTAPVLDAVRIQATVAELSLSQVSFRLQLLRQKAQEQSMPGEVLQALAADQNAVDVMMPLLDRTRIDSGTAAAASQALMGVRGGTAALRKYFTADEMSGLFDEAAVNALLNELGAAKDVSLENVWHPRLKSRHQKQQLETSA